MFLGRLRTHAVSACLILAQVSCIGAPSTPHDEPGNDGVRQDATAPSRGFNDRIAWRRLDEGLAEAARSHRPLMLVVHAAWCRSCQALKPRFGDGTLVDLSRDFVMVNLDQDLEPRSLEFAPDGAYVPRVVFLEPRTGRPDPDIQNHRRSNNRYYYGPQDDLLGAMRTALARHGEG